VSFYSKGGTNFGRDEEKVRAYLDTAFGKAAGGTDKSDRCTILSSKASSKAGLAASSISPADQPVKARREMKALETMSAGPAGVRRHSCLNALCDTGNPSALGGKVWFDEYSSLMCKAGYSAPPLTLNHEPMAFGDGPASLPLGDAAIPLFYRRRSGKTNVVIKNVRTVNHAAGLLDGLKDMRAMQTHLELENSGVVMQQLHQSDALQAELPNSHMFAVLDPPRPLLPRESVCQLIEGENGSMLAAESIR
jgi:hypothetical protein